MNILRLFCMCGFDLGYLLLSRGFSAMLRHLIFYYFRSASSSHETLYLISCTLQEASDESHLGRAGET